MSDAPKHSVSVAGVVVRSDGAILVVQRRDNGHWEPPGGILELDETFQEGVEREVFEETGVRVVVGHLTGVYKNLPRKVVALVFRCSYMSGEAVVTSESVATEWITQSQIAERMTPAYAVRVLDALTGTNSAPVRAHDGVELVERDS